MSTNIIKNNIVNINMICMNIKERVLEKKKVKRLRWEKSLYESGK